ncbi:hypothetical protein ACVIN2_003208 [Bradyrhizobium sp. USDA 3650]
MRFFWCDDALAVADAARIDLEDHQRQVRIHSESGGVVDHDSACPDRDRRVRFGDAVAVREQGDVVSSSITTPLLQNDIVLPGERELASASACQSESRGCPWRREFGAPPPPVTADNREHGIVTHIFLHFRLSMIWSETRIPLFRISLCRQQKSAGPMAAGLR